MARLCKCNSQDAQGLKKAFYKDHIVTDTAVNKANTFLVASQSDFQHLESLEEIEFSHALND